MAMNARRNRSIACVRSLPAWCAAWILAVAVPPTAPAAGVGLAQLPQRWLGDDGRSLALDSLAGRRVVLTMAFAGCHVICPLAISQLQQMQRQLDARGERADFVIVGYDPENERPADWRAFRANRHLDRSNWHFLSGSRDDTERLAHQLGFEFWKYDEHVMHGMRALVFDAHGQLQLELGPETKNWASAI
jgi:cytochrome oxidase Cu insertion factor (SCO1/SenC/PrrC family)